MLKKTDYKQKQEELRMLLETITTAEGKQTKFVQKKSKMTAACFGQTMVLGCLERPDASLVDLAQVSADLDVEITASGLNQRINERGKALLRKILAKSIQLRRVKEIEPELLQQFTAVQILDSSYVGLPASLHEQFPGIGGAEATGMKLFLNYEYLRGEITALEITAGRCPDQKNRLHVTSARPGSLHLFDLGFFKQEIFGEIAKRNAYFISRLQHQTALYWQENDKESFDIAAYLKKGSIPHQVSLNVYLGQKARVPIRLVCQRLPSKVATERKRKAKASAKQDGRRNGVSKRHLQLLEWAIFITNVPEDLLSVDQILLIYRLRWQIELIFKLWKSRAQLKSIGNWRPERVLCQIYARLIGLMLFHWLVAPLVTSLKTISLPKAFCRLQHHVGKIVTVISKHWRGLEQVLQRIDRDILRFAMQDKRKTSPSTYQLLVEAGL